MDADVDVERSCKIIDARFDHCFKVPSVMDSAISGTLIIVSATLGC